MTVDLKNIHISFPGGKHKALTMSFDDGREEDEALIDLLDQYGVKCTFNINSGLQGKGRLHPGQWGTIYKGHEIACHTVTHPTIARCPTLMAVQQILQDRAALERAAGYPVRGLAWPNGSYSPELSQALPLLGIQYARTIKDTYGFDIPVDFCCWHPTCHFKRRAEELAEEFAALNKQQYLNLFFVWGHSYELADGGWETMERILKTAARREDTWYATNIQIVDYLNQAKHLQCSADGTMIYNPNFRPIWITAGGENVEIPGGHLIHL